VFFIQAWRVAHPCRFFQTEDIRAAAAVEVDFGVQPFPVPGHFWLYTFMVDGILPL
jgi:hypothetical protein